MEDSQLKADPSKYLLISVRPEFANRIYSGTKLREIRKLFPDISPGTVVVIYESGSRRAISGWFVAGLLTWHHPEELWDRFSDQTGLRIDEFQKYCGDRDIVASIRIDKPVQLASSIGLDELRNLDPAFHPPQNFRYLRTLPDRVRELIWSLLDLAPAESQMALS